MGNHTQCSNLNPNIETSGHEGRIDCLKTFYSIIYCFCLLAALYRSKKEKEDKARFQNFQS